MRLVRFGVRGQEKPGIVTAEGRITDVSAHVRDYDHVAGLCVANDRSVCQPA